MAMRFVVAILVVGLAVMLSLFAQLDDWKRDLTSNHARLDSNSADARLHPPLIRNESPAEVSQRIIAWAETAPRWNVVEQEVTEAESKLHLTHATRIFGWIDDVHVRLGAVPEGTRLNAESQSRVGKADFGQNPRNLRELLQGIGAIEPAQ